MKSLSGNTEVTREPNNIYVYITVETFRLLYFKKSSTKNKERMD